MMPAKKKLINGQKGIKAFLIQKPIIEDECLNTDCQASSFKEISQPPNDPFSSMNTNFQIEPVE